MFDWNDEELANIIWGETGVIDDHIVPYFEESEDYHNKKEWRQETATTRQTEQKSLGTKTDIYGKQDVSCSNFENNEGTIASGIRVDSLAELSVSNAAKSVETAKLDKDPENFQNSHEGKEQGEFVDDGWANIGSFDDLDQIFSKDDTIFGQVSLCNADGLWSSSKDVASPVKSYFISSDSPDLGFGALRNISVSLEIKTEDDRQGDQSFTHIQGKDYDMQKEQSVLDHENIGAKNKDIEKKLNVQRKLWKGGRKAKARGEGKLLQNLCDNWSTTGKSSGQFGNLTPSVQSFHPSAASKQALHGHEPLLNQQGSNPLKTPAYGNHANTYPIMHVMSLHTGEFKHRPMSSSYVSRQNVNPINMPTGASVNRLIMTPREKIEKLKRRQRMRAMHAIQIQQQQFHQVPCTDHFIPQERSQESQFYHVDGDALEGENLRTLPFLNPSPIEQDDSDEISMAVNNPVEEIILYQLQDVIAKLDIRIRLHMRESLFSLAKSAKQRHSPGDTSSANKIGKDEHETVIEQEYNKRERYTSMPYVETKTNPIDRTVAYMLFHMPIEISVNHQETPESPAYTKSLCESRNASSSNLSIGEKFPENTEIKQNISHHGYVNPYLLEENQHKDKFQPCIDMSAYNDHAESGALELDASC